MELIVNNLDLYKSTTKYEFDMGNITDEQWLKFGEEFVRLKEEGYEKNIPYILENSVMHVRFKEPAKTTDPSMIAKVRLEYLRENDECISLNYNFDAEGEVGAYASELSRCWRNVMLNCNKGNNV